MNSLPTKENSHRNINSMISPARYSILFPSPLPFSEISSSPSPNPSLPIMDDSEIDKFLAETNALDDSVHANPLYSSFIPQLSPMAANPTEAPMASSLPPPNPPQAAFMSQSMTQNAINQPMSDHYPTQPYYPSHQLSLTKPIASTSNFANPLSQVINHDWEGVICYLAGVVRPGPDVPQIYKCKICAKEFPSFHAYGGHRSSHSKVKRMEKKEGKVGKEKAAKKTKKKDVGGKGKEKE